MRKVPARAIAVPGLNWTCLESAARRAGRQPVEREFERVHISLPAKAANHAFSLVGEIRVMPERFAAMYVRQMNLDERDADPRQCVPNGHAGVRVRGGIDQYEIGLFSPGGLDAIDESAFMIALERREFDACVRCAVRKCLIDLRQRYAAINLRFPGAEKVEVGAVQYQQSRHGRFFFRGIGRTLALIRETCLVSRAEGLIPAAFDEFAGCATSRNFMQFARIPACSDHN